MTREYILQDLDCANCAVMIERVISKKPGIKSVTLNLAMSKLVVESEGLGNTELFGVVEEAVKLFEPDVEVLEAAAGEKLRVDTAVSKSKIIWLACGALLFFVGLIFEYAIAFTGSQYVAAAVLIASYLLLGSKVLLRMVKNIAKGQIFDENFLMGVATLGAAAIGMFAEAVAVMLFYQVGEFFQELAVSKSKKRIADLMDIRPDFANVITDGEITKTSPEDVKIGDIFVVRPGERIPLDGIVTEGEAMLDTTALTGESVPRRATVLDEVLSGCINQNGVLTVRATKAFGESTVSKILDLVENAANKKARTETFITKFARLYTPAVVGLAVILAVFPPLFLGGAWIDWISRALIFLVISCPCALVLSIPLGFFGGIGGASKKGILVKGGNYLEALANVDIAVFDKTGTLTKGVFKVAEINPSPGFSTGELLKLTACAESFSNHPIALSILNEFGSETNREDMTQFEEIAGLGVSVVAGGRRILAGNGKLMDERGISFTPSTAVGTKVYTAVDGVFAGCIVIADKVKEDSLGLAKALKNLGVRKNVMLTGDSAQIAQVISEELNFDEVHANLLPQQKVEKLEELQKSKLTKRSLVFVGDGINDAPVLAMADIGVAMGGLGSDAAIEAADVVLMTDEPSKLVEAVRIARFTKRIVWQNIVVALGVKLLFLFLATLGVSSLWEAVFADVGVSLLAVFNSLRVMNMK